MKINRWILFPLIIILSYVLPRILFGDSSFDVLFWLFYGTIAGFGTLIWSNHKAKQLTGENCEEIHQARQHREVTLLLNYEKTFAVCRQAAESLDPVKIITESFSEGVIKFRTKINWYSFGYIFTVNLKKLNENLTEVEIFTRPIPRTVIISSGYSWKYIEDFCSYIKEKDAELNRKVLTDSAEILTEVYVKPFQKGKVETGAGKV